MAKHSFTYLWRTVWLKTIAHASFKMEGLGLLKPLKQKNKTIIANWLALPNKAPLWQPGYLAYGFLKSPSELTELLVFDENNIPLGWKHAKPIAYNPLMVSYLALVFYNHFLYSQQENSRVQFLRLVAFLEDFGEEKVGGFWLPYHQSIPKFGLKGPWYSGLAQAVAMSVFIRAYELTGSLVLKTRAEQLCKTLVFTTKAGGFFEKNDDGTAWIQEYPTQQVRHVLNGLLFCLISLYEYQVKISENSAVAQVLADCEASLLHKLPQYFVGKYTRYAGGRAVFSNVEYDGLFVFLWLHLHRVSGKTVYLELAKRFHRNAEWKLFFEFYGITNYGDRLPKNLEQHD